MGLSDAPARPTPAIAAARARQTSAGAGLDLSVFVITAGGVARAAEPAQLRELIVGDRFFWVDLVGNDAAARAAFLAELEFEEADRLWIQRFGQAGRMSINQRRLRAVTWLSQSDEHGLTEIHILSTRRGAVTGWDGDPRALASVRERFSERMERLEGNPSQAAAILLQMILSTLHAALSSVDARLQATQTQLAEAPAALDLLDLNHQMQRLQRAWSEIERYSGAVKGALIGLEAVPGLDARGVDELNLYSERVEDLETRLKERAQWGGDLLRDGATAIAHLQSQQINRLTLVSIIFLPLTFLTGFFGMNFTWMIKMIGGSAAFLMLGVGLPTAIAVATILWFTRLRRTRLGG